MYRFSIDTNILDNSIRQQELRSGVQTLANNSVDSTDTFLWTHFEIITNS